jgi:hypothetical protein
VVLRGTADDSVVAEAKDIIYVNGLGRAFYLNLREEPPPGIAGDPLADRLGGLRARTAISCPTKKACLNSSCDSPTASLPSWRRTGTKRGSFRMAVWTGSWIGKSNQHRCITMRRAICG